MAQDITKLTTKNWQHKRNTIGEVAVDIYDIEQCIKTIATTQKGEVPFMPELGINFLEGIGEESENAILYYKTQYLKEIPRQEPRCEVIDVTGKFDENGQIKMVVYFKEILNDLPRKTEVWI